eukprot:TRINITY_DN16583_c0_g1_i6.p2 TRINITY_DN16583_c0_g1~~TRINITY_DN16583_c0_g1_i6.p2  ORF type:complete len:177 (-),score=12.58 TRINITY_DN16583_c0_g1_i6:208-714(-)
MIGQRISVATRVKEFPDDFEIVRGKFMCKYCNREINWKKEDTIKKHLRSDAHRKNKHGGKQLTLEKILSGTTSGSEIIDDFLSMMIQCDIPLYKVDKMRPFLKKHCIDGGFIPSSSGIRKSYLTKYCEKERKSVLSKLYNEPVSLLIDGSTDMRSRKVLHVIARVNYS